MIKWVIWSVISVEVPMNYRKRNLQGILVISECSGNLKYTEKIIGVMEGKEQKKAKTKLKELTGGFVLSSNLWGFIVRSLNLL